VESRSVRGPAQERQGGGERSAVAVDPALLDALAVRIADLGREIGLPYIAASADISSSAPLTDSRGQPLAETLFRWIDPDLQYWRERGFALKAPFVIALRYAAEPFYFHDGGFASWRPQPWLEAMEVAERAMEHGVGGAIIAPVHLPGGAVGGVVWATDRPRRDLPEVYAARASELHAAAIRFIAACHDSAGWRAEPARLTPREVQCLKWAAAGKTDADIAQIVGISMSTTRFHIRNATAKLGAVGRAQAIHRASALGYIGPVRGP